MSRFSFYIIREHFGRKLERSRGIGGTKESDTGIALIEEKGEMAMGGTHGERGRDRDHNHCFFVSVCMQRETEKHGLGAERQG